MVFPSEAFEPLAVLEAVSEEKCTALQGVPTMFIGELEHPDFSRFDMSHLRSGTMAGAPCPIEIMRKVISEMNMVEGHHCLWHDRDQPGQLPERF